VSGAWCANRAVSPATLRDLLVVGLTEFVNRIDHGAGVTRIDTGVDAVAEIENVPVARAVARQYLRDLRAYMPG
jgi:hypothetical protein